jgi:hypothetical protein
VSTPVHLKRRDVDIRLEIGLDKASAPPAEWFSISNARCNGVIGQALWICSVPCKQQLLSTRRSARARFRREGLGHAAVLLFWFGGSTVTSGLLISLSPAFRIRRMLELLGAASIGLAACSGMKRFSLPTASLGECDGLGATTQLCPRGYSVPEVAC